MASMNQSARSIPISGPGEGARPVNVPRVLMSWEDWLTFAAVVVAFMAVAVSIQQSQWVDNMPSLIPTVGGGLVIGLVAARARYHALLIQPVALAVGAVVVLAMVQTYATGETAQDRLVDVRDRMQEWWSIVRNDEISNDNLPFVLLVHSIAMLAAYFASWSIFRWHIAWLALIPGAFVLLSNISFQREQPAAAFVVFIIAAMLIVARTYLQGSQRRWRKEGVGYPDLISLDALTITVLVSIGVVVGAWQVPLADEDDLANGVVTWFVEPFEPLQEDAIRLFNTVNGAGGGTFHSFGDTLAIRGDVEISNRRLFRVESSAAGLVRATSYDRYTGVGWQATDRDSERVEGVEFQERAAEEYLDRSATQLRVTVLDDISILLALGIPAGTNLRSYVDTPEGFSGDIERLRSVRGLDNGDTYIVIGSVSVATPDALRDAGNGYPDWVTERYLQLPDDLPERVREEAFFRAGGAENPYDQAVALQDYLRTFEYSFQVPTAPPGRDIVDYTLFDLKQGYFDYQATSMAVMLRTIGIPARVAVGFSLDPDNIEDGAFTVRDTNAFAWVEVFFPEYGWIVFNPTSTLPSGGANARGDSTFDINDLGGLNDPAISDLLNGELLGPVADNPAVPGALSEPPVDVQPAPWWILWTALAVLGVAAVVAAGGWTAWNRGLAGLDGTSGLWARTHRLAGWARIGTRPEETPREWGRRLGDSLHCEQDAALLADAYQEARYGAPGQRRIEDEEAAAAYRRLRGALIAKIVRWKRRPPTGEADQDEHTS